MNGDGTGRGWASFMDTTFTAFLQETDEGGRRGPVTLTDDGTSARENPQT